MKLCKNVQIAGHFVYLYLSLQLIRVLSTTRDTINTHEAVIFNTQLIKFLFSGETSPWFLLIQLYLKVVKIVLDYILDILCLYNGTLPN
jgi:hypothetical protein